MADKRAQLAASERAAVAAKDAFVTHYARGRPDRAVGIGLDEAGTSWVVKVLVHDAEAARDLPTSFRNFKVEVEIVGMAEAY